MDSYTDQTYGDAWAELYDEVFPAPAPEVIEFVTARAEGGPVLELAVGTGRVAIPLVAAGVEVHGVEISPQMIDVLHRRPDKVPIVASDMTRFRLDRRYPLVLLGANTLFVPLEEEAQRGVFRATAAALETGGRFVIECFVPDLDRFDRDQTVRAREVSADHVMIEFAIHDPDLQVIRSMMDIRWTKGRSALLPVQVRYLWPQQIDEMASGSGLELEERYEWYDEAPFTDASPRHVSVYRKL